MAEFAGSIRQAIQEEVTLAAYDESWPMRFRTERDRLLDLFLGRFATIEHFGSTAIPGMIAKPIIDLIAGVESMAVADELFDPLLVNGYTTSRDFNAMLPDRRWFMRVAGGRRTHHLHLVEMDGRQWRERLRFRDLLRADAKIAAEYARLKQELAARHRTDREAYTQAKTQFVAAVLAG